ncbi:MAG: ATP-binding cassette domain-containing protein [Chloroflexi bacterium]|nr:ATP-binding cassette domain-containing protein [Chloroflexota bacterium]
MINLERVSYRYPKAERDALQVVDLAIAQGESVLIAGKSGSGKSTLLRVVNGLVPHFFGGTFRGKALISKLNTRHSNPLEIARYVATVFQNPKDRFVTSSVEDEIAFGLELGGVPTAEIQRRMENLFDRIDIRRLARRPLDRLSAGELQLAAIAAALVRAPKIILLDEPTSQLDPLATDAVLAWVKDLKEQLGITILISEHRIGKLVRDIDRIAFLGSEGKLRHYGASEEVLLKLPFGIPELAAARKIGKYIEKKQDWRKELKTRLQLLGSNERESVSTNGINPRLAAQHVSYKYNGQSALEKASIEIFPGEIVVLTGRNGAGKSTLLRCIMGLLSPIEGTIFLDDLNVTRSTVQERSKRIAFVPQWPSALLFADSVAGELDFTLRAHALSAKPPIAPALLLKKLGIEDLADRYPRDLSAGQQQRTALAAVLITRPKVILLDEPTLGMDPNAQEDLGRLLVQWRSEGASILIATHDVEFAATYADRVLVMDQGHIIKQGPTAETLFSQPELRTSLQRLTLQPFPASPQEL